MGVILWQAGVFPLGMGTSEPTTTTVPSVTTTMTTTATQTTVTYTTATPTTIPGGRLLTVSAGTDMPVYTAWDPVKINVTFRNDSGMPLTLESMPPILSIMEAETHQPVYTFGAGDNTLTLARDGMTTFTYEWNQLDFDGRPVAGRFYIELEDLELNGIPLPLELDKTVGFDVLTER